MSEMDDAFDDLTKSPEGQRAKAEILDVMLALSTAFAAAGDQQRTLTSIMTVVTEFDPTELLMAAIVRGAKFVRMIAEGTGQTTDQVVRGVLMSTHNDPEDIAMFDDTLKLLRSITREEGNGHA